MSWRGRIFDSIIGRADFAADADGNNIAGVRAPMVQAPLGTYCG